MTKQRLDRLVQFSGIVVLGGIVFLAAQADIQRWTMRESSAGGRLTAPVSCVLPVTAGDPPTPAAGIPEAGPPDCGTFTPHPLRSAWITAC